MDTNAYALYILKPSSVHIIMNAYYDVACSTCCNVHVLTISFKIEGRAAGDRLLASTDRHKVVLHASKKKDLGFSIRGGSEYSLGIYISWYAIADEPLVNRARLACRLWTFTSLCRHKPDITLALGKYHPLFPFGKFIAFGVSEGVNFPAENNGSYFPRARVISYTEFPVIIGFR